LAQGRGVFFDMNSTNLKITIVLPSLCGGGAERLHVNLANEWISQGFNVEFILLRKEGALLPMVEHKINVVGLDVDRIRSVILPFAAHLRKSRPDVVLVAMWPLTSAAVLGWLISGRIGKLFLSDHENLSASYVAQGRVKPSFLRSLIRFTYPLATGIIAVSRGVKRDLCELGKFTDNLVRVIYNPAALGVSSRRESMRIQQRLWGGVFKHHILSVGTLKAQKDHENLIRAFAILPAKLNAKLIILGEGSLRLELEALILQFGLKDKVSMIGFVVDPYPWFRSADLFVLSSRWEGFGNVIVEALECGVPVVSTDCPSGPAEILEKGRYGKLVPIQDPISLASAMEVSLNTIHDREELMKRAKDFSIEKISDEYLNYIFPEGY
jgi:glycosyltransferase involved in cell wall biosynthesis